MPCAEWCTGVDSQRLSTVELKSKTFLAVDSGACPLDHQLLRRQAVYTKGEVVSLPEPINHRWACDPWLTMGRGSVAGRWAGIRQLATATPPGGLTRGVCP
eukprot:8404061-Pyramimonas_sp.AAC.1